MAGAARRDARQHPQPSAARGGRHTRTGRVGRIGTLNTKTLVIAGEGGIFTTPSGEPGAMLRAYDKMTGEEVGEVYMPAPQSGSPMTYVLDGVQYIVVATSGSGQPGRLLRTGCRRTRSLRRRTVQTPGRVGWAPSGAEGDDGRLGGS